MDESEKRQFDQSAAVARSDDKWHELEGRICRLEERSRWVTQGQTAASTRFVSWEAFRPIQRIVNLSVAAVLGTAVTLGLGLVVKWLVGGFA